MVDLEDTLKNIIRTESGKDNRDIAEFYFNSGEIALQKRDYNTAKKEYINALNWEECGQYYNGLCTALLNLNEEKEALTILEKALVIHSTNSSQIQYLKQIKSKVHYQFGIRLQSEQKYSSAVVEYKQAVELGMKKIPELEQWGKEGVITLSDWNGMLRFARALDDIIEAYNTFRKGDIDNVKSELCGSIHYKTHDSNENKSFSRLSSYSLAERAVAHITFNLKDIDFYFHNLFQNREVFENVSSILSDRTVPASRLPRKIEGPLKGEFISAMINKVIKDNEEINLTIKTDVDNLGYRHSKGKLIINSSEKSRLFNVAEYMSGGEVIVNGPVICLGQSMKSGRIIVSGYMYGTVGLEMHGGTIESILVGNKPLDYRFSGDSKNKKLFYNSIGEKMWGGKITISDKSYPPLETTDWVNIGCNMVSGEIFIEGDKIRKGVGLKSSGGRIYLKSNVSEINDQFGHGRLFVDGKSLIISKEYGDNFIGGEVTFNGKQIIPSLSYRIRRYFHSTFGDGTVTYTRNDWFKKSKRLNFFE